MGGSRDGWMDGEIDGFDRRMDGAYAKQDGEMDGEIIG